MTTMKIAEQLVEFCKLGRNGEALNTLFGKDVVSVEAMVMPDGKQETVGLDAVKAKWEWWTANHEVHSAVVAGPWPLGKRFIVGFRYDVTNKPSGMRRLIEEMALYTVQDGKIVREEFFYDTET